MHKDIPMFALRFWMNGFRANELMITIINFIRMVDGFWYSLGKNGNFCGLMEINFIGFFVVARRNI